MQNKYDFFFFFEDIFLLWRGEAGRKYPPESHNMGQNGEFISTFFAVCGKKVYILKSATNSDADLFCCLLFHLTIVLPLQT